MARRHASGALSGAGEVADETRYDNERRSASAVASVAPTRLKQPRRSCDRSAPGGVRRPAPMSWLRSETSSRLAAASSVAASAAKEAPSRSRCRHSACERSVVRAIEAVARDRDRLPTMRSSSGVCLSQVGRERQSVFGMADGRDDDAVLVARIARGDRTAFATIYDRYLPLVLRWSLRETGNREVAADLAAETFAAALIASPRYRPGKGSVATWMLGIARNKLRESRRRRRVEDSARRRVGLDSTTFGEADFERVEELTSLDAGVMELLEGLAPALREAVSQRVIEERSYEEIADQLRCSESVVRQRVSRGLRNLRSELEGR